MSSDLLGKPHFSAVFWISEALLTLPFALSWLGFVAFPFYHTHPDSNK